MTHGAQVPSASLPFGRKGALRRDLFRNLFRQDSGRNMLLLPGRIARCQGTGKAGGGGPFVGRRIGVLRVLRLLRSLRFLGRPGVLGIGRNVAFYPLQGIGEEQLAFVAQVIPGEIGQLIDDLPGLAAGGIVRLTLGIVDGGSHGVDDKVIRTVDARHGDILAGGSYADEVHLHVGAQAVDHHFRS